MAKTTADRGRRRPRRDRRRSAVVLATTAGFAAAAFAGASVVPPRYRAEASVILEMPAPSREGWQSGTLPADLDPALAMTSSEVLAEVARRLDLSSREEFAGSSWLSGRLAELFGEMSGAPDGIVEAMRERLRVYPARNLRIVVAEFAARDPALARDVANAIVGQYLARAGPREEGDGSADWLEGEIAELAGRVRASSDRLAEMRALAAGEDGEAERRLAAMAEDLAQARAAREAAEARARRLEAALAGGRSLDWTPEGPQALSLRPLVERRNALAGEKAELSLTLLDGHPRMRALNAQLGEVEAEVAREAAALEAALRQEASDAAGRAASLEAEVAQVRDAAGEAERLRAEIASQEQYLAAERELLDRFLAREDAAPAPATVGTAAAAHPRLFAAAQLPTEPYFPKVGPITAAGGLAGLLLSSLALLLARALSPRARQPHPEEAAPAGLAGGVLPAGLQEDAAAPARAPEAASTTEAASVDEMAKAVVASAISRVVVVSSSAEAGGGVELARRLSSRGRSSLLVDLSPGDAAARSMGVSEEAAGLADLIHGTAASADIVQRDRFTATHVVRSRGAATDLAGGRLPDLASALDALTAGYDHTVLVVGPDEAASLRPLMHRNAALLLSAGAEGEGRPILERLRQAGFDEVLLMRWRARATRSSRSHDL